MSREKYEVALELLRQGILSINEEGQVWRHHDKRSGACLRRIDSPSGKRGEMGYHCFSIPQGVGTATYCIQVHRMHWEWRVGPIPEGMEINHIDYNPANNRLSNLEVVTPQANIDHSTKGGRWLGRGMKDTTQDQASEARRMFRLGHTAKGIGAAMGISNHKRIFGWCRHEDRREGGMSVDWVNDRLFKAGCQDCDVWVRLDGDEGRLATLRKYAAVELVYRGCPHITEPLS